MGNEYLLEHLKVENEALRYELSQQRRANVELQDQFLQYHRIEMNLQQTQNLFQLVVDNLPGSVFWKDIHLIYQGCNQSFAEDAGVGKPDNIVGKSDYDLAWKLEESEFFRDTDQRVITTGVAEYHIIESQLQADGKQAWIDTNKIPLYDSEGSIIGLLGTYEDITERKHLEESHTALQQEVIEAHKKALRELSTPLIPISSHVVLMPLIGSIDIERVQRVMETLLEGIAAHSADVAILDMTGVSVINTQVANTLVQTAQAVTMLGAKVVLTGISPAMAQTLIHLGADLSNIQVRGNLQRAIEDALMQRV